MIAFRRGIGAVCLVFIRTVAFLLVRRIVAKSLPTHPPLLAQLSWWGTMDCSLCINSFRIQRRCSITIHTARQSHVGLGVHQSVIRSARMFAAWQQRVESDSRLQQITYHLKWSLNELNWDKSYEINYRASQMIYFHFVLNLPMTTWHVSIRIPKWLHENSICNYVYQFPISKSIESLLLKWLMIRKK